MCICHWGCPYIEGSLFIRFPFESRIRDSVLLFISDVCCIFYQTSLYSLPNSGLQLSLIILPFIWRIHFYLNLVKRFVANLSYFSILTMFLSLYQVIYIHGSLANDLPVTSFIFCNFIIGTQVAMLGGVHYGFTRQVAHMCVMYIYRRGGLSFYRLPSSLVAQVSFKVLIKSHVAFYLFFLFRKRICPFVKLIYFVLIQMIKSLFCRRFAYFFILEPNKQTYPLLVSIYQHGDLIKYAFSLFQFTFLFLCINCTCPSKQQFLLFYIY